MADYLTPCFSASGKTGACKPRKAPREKHPTHVKTLASHFGVSAHVLLG
jgi:hypothetical protein